MADLWSAWAKHQALTFLGSGTWKVMLLDNSLDETKFTDDEATWFVDDLPETNASNGSRQTLTVSTDYNTTDDLAEATHSAAFLTWSTLGSPTPGTNPIQYVHLFKDAGTDATSELGFLFDIGEWSNWGGTLRWNISTGGELVTVHDGVTLS